MKKFSVYMEFKNYNVNNYKKKFTDYWGFREVAPVWQLVDNFRARLIEVVAGRRHCWNKRM